MKKFLILIILLISGIFINAQNKCYLWGFVDKSNENSSEWKYIEMIKNAEGIFECDVNISGGFYVMLSNMADMSNASWENVFKMFGIVAYDRYNATFYHSYDAWYPMKKLTDWPDTEWIMFNPKPGFYKCYIDLSNPMPVIALIKIESGIDDIFYFKEYKIKAYNINGQDVTNAYINKIPGFYIINNKKIVLH